MTQPSLFEEKPTPNAKTLTAIVLKIMSDGKWRFPWEVSSIILSEYKVRVSDSSLTARLRELRGVKFGYYTVEKRRGEDSNAYEYRVTR